jgi:hypothetical protein
MPVLKEMSKVDGMRVMSNLIVMVDPFVVVMNKLRFQEIIMLKVVTFDDSGGNELLEVVIN